MRSVSRSIASHSRRRRRRSSWPPRRSPPRRRMVSGRPAAASRAARSPSRARRSSASGSGRPKRSSAPSNFKCNTSNLVVKASKIKISGGKFSYDGPAYIDKFRAKTKLGTLVWTRDVHDGDERQGQVPLHDRRDSEGRVTGITFKKKKCDSGTKSWTGSLFVSRRARSRWAEPPSRAGAHVTTLRSSTRPAASTKSSRAPPRVRRSRSAPGGMRSAKRSASALRRAIGTFAWPPAPETSWRIPSWSASRWRS